MQALDVSVNQLGGSCEALEPLIGLHELHISQNNFTGQLVSGFVFQKLADILRC